VTGSNWLSTLTLASISAIILLVPVMASVYNPAHNESHIKHLLQQRTAPSNNHSLFQSLSDFPDSPSVYSRSQFTPRQPEHSQRFDEHIASNRDRIHSDTIDFGQDPRSS